MDHEQPPYAERQPISSISSIQHSTIQILTASYGPAEGRRLLDGTLVDYSNRESCIPYTRDVIPFLAALASNEYTLEHGDGGPCFNIGKKNAIALMDGKSMNSIFGDPCPGTTKILKVEYLFRDYYWSCDGSDKTGGSDSGGKRKQFLQLPQRKYTSTFAEHDRVLLKRQDALFRLQARSQDEADQKPHAISDSGPNRRSVQQPEDTSSTGNCLENIPDLSPSSSSTNDSTSIHLQSAKQSLVIASPSTVHNSSEITLRLVLPYLRIRERAKCQLVCSSWKRIVIDTGIAVAIDVNDTSLFPKGSASINARPNIASLSPFVPPSPAELNENSEKSNNVSRELLRGLLTHSHSSLESLVLNDYLPLRPSIDLHPTLPHLRKLKRLDISRIPAITDETLHLISTFVGPRLEVLYMKGLRHVTNAGVVHLARSCTNLRVLDVSYLHQLEDEAGVAIGEHLTKLRVFHARDNYRWTNKSVDLITANCKKLAQVTFWGCIRLDHVYFGDTNSVAIDDNSAYMTNPNQAPVDSIPSRINNPSNRNLIVLNLWGCHGLQNSSAAFLSTLTQLRSLCVSECHKLSDEFVIGITQSLRQLLHLQLRYLRRITDDSIESISAMLPNLYSLDVSFCTKLTVGAIAKLLQERSESLAELRLFSCRQLNLEGRSVSSNARGIRGGMPNGRRLAQALLSSRQNCILSILDLRKCDDETSLIRDEAFLRDMADLGFMEELRGFFRRPAFWNGRTSKQLAEILTPDI